MSTHPYRRQCMDPKVVRPGERGAALPARTCSHPRGPFHHHLRRFRLHRLQASCRRRDQRLPPRSDLPEHRHPWSQAGDRSPSEAEARPPVDSPAAPPLCTCRSVHTGMEGCNHTNSRTESQRPGRFAGEIRSAGNGALRRPAAAPFPSRRRSSPPDLASVPQPPVPGWGLAGSPLDLAGSPQDTEASAARVPPRARLPSA